MDVGALPPSPHEFQMNVTFTHTHTRTERTDRQKEGETDQPRQTENIHGTATGTPIAVAKSSGSLVSACEVPVPGWGAASRARRPGGPSRARPPGSHSVSHRQPCSTCCPESSSRCKRKACGVERCIPQTVPPHRLTALHQDLLNARRVARPTGLARSRTR